MAVFRVERTRDYTVMCNHHLKDSNLSLKAKGLLSMMLSLPDEWNYTTRGLAAICKEGVDAIGKTLKELELAGYIIRRQLRGKDGRISDTEYTIFEKPRKPSPPDTTLPDTENPYLDNPDTEAPDTDNPAQLNTKKSNTQKSNTDLSSTHSFFLPAADGMTDGFEKKAEIREQIEYDILCQQYDRMQLDELVEIMLEVAMNRSPTVKIGRDAEYPTGFVQQRFEKITSMKNIPVYKHTAAYAREHDELAAYRASNQVNVACKEAIEATIRDHYRDNRLDTAAVDQVVQQFGYDRAFHILAITVCQADWDRRYSPDNRAWANAMSIPANPDAWGTDRNCYLAVSSHPGLVDLFLSQTRKAYAQERQKTSVRDMLKKLPETTSPKISAKSKDPER